MKHLLFIVLLVVILIIAGCVSEEQTTVVTPTQTTSTPIVVQAQDPIIGVWRNDSNNIDFRVRFTSNKTLMSSTSYKDGLRIQYGSWEPKDSTSYLILIYTLPSISDTLIYDPERDVLYSKETFSVLTRYSGEITTLIVSTPTTPALTPTPFS
jgi:hypothetical protein